MRDPIDRFIRQHLQPGDVALDIGANQGLYTKTMLARRATVYAFEPNPEMATVLSGTIRDPRLRIVQKAVGATAGPIDFFIDLRPGAGAVASSVHQLDDLVDQTRRVTVECTTVDLFCNTNGIHPQFIKVDVEGNERPVFAGAKETLAQSAPFIIFEFWETWWRRGVSEIFEQLAPSHELIVLGTGEDAYALYSAEGDSGHRQGSVDIGCIPRSKRRNVPRRWTDWILRR